MPSKRSAMNVQEAVSAAKIWVTEVFKEEHISKLGLEEVVHDESERVWRITLGFSRVLNSDLEIPNILKMLPSPRFFKVITVKEPSGEVVSMRDRETE
jgi:hypothetical protein